MAQSTSLHELIRMTGNGDPSAHEALYTEIRQPLLNFILSRFGSTLTMQDAEDVVHSMFVRLPHEASRYKGIHNEASAKKWLYKIVYNEALKMANTVRKTPNLLDGPYETMNELEQDPAAPERSLSLSDLKWEGEYSVEERALNATFLEKIFSSVQFLSIEERQMLILRFEYGYTFEQIGHQIGRTKPRAKQIIDGLIHKIRKYVGVDPSQD